MTMYKQLAENKRNKSAAVAESVLKSVEALRNEGTEPTFNAILAYLSSRNILSNHRSLRVYLDAMINSEMLTLQKEPVKQPNVRPKQIYSLKSDGPFVEAGERAMLFHGLNWTVPSKSSIKLKTDIEGLARARIVHGTVYASLEDTIVGTLAKNKNTERLFQTLTFCAALLATKKFDRDYLIQRATRRNVGETVERLLEEIGYVLNSPKPEVEDIRTLYEIRKQLANRGLRSSSYNERKFPLSPDEMVDIIGKQLGVK
ncbi:MAG: hypothetical protein ABSD49_13280 [Candidatus Bathyarchaeia archaeon]